MPAGFRTSSRAGPIIPRPRLKRQILVDGLMTVWVGNNTTQPHQDAKQSPVKYTARQLKTDKLEHS